MMLLWCNDEPVVQFYIRPLNACCCARVLYFCSRGFHSEIRCIYIFAIKPNCLSIFSSFGYFVGCFNEVIFLITFSSTSKQVIAIEDISDESFSRGFLAWSGSGHNGGLRHVNPAGHLPIENNARSNFYPGS